jgi:putrescine transport system substrate-binding protein
MWFDMVAIPKDAPHPDHAHAFLNFLMEPTVIAAISDAVGQANANAAALPFVNETLRNDPSVYPTDEVRKRLHTDRLVSPEQGRMEDRAWARIKYGQ